MFDPRPEMRTATLAFFSIIIPVKVGTHFPAWRQEWSSGNKPLCVALHAARALQQSALPRPGQPFSPAWIRAETSRGGEECVRTGSMGGAPVHEKKQQKEK